MCVTENVPGALVFIGMAWMSFQKHFLNPAGVLEELESIASLRTVSMRSASRRLSVTPQVLRSTSTFWRVAGSMGGRIFGYRSKKDWNYISRLYHIQHMSNDASRMIWSRALGLIVWVFVLLAIAAASSSSETTSEGSDPGITFPSTNTYLYKEPPQPARNPLCRLDTTTDNMKYLPDYAFLGE